MSQKLALLKEFKNNKHQNSIRFNLGILQGLRLMIQINSIISLMKYNHVN